MRALISKVMAGSMIAGAALMVSACGPKTDTTNTTVTDMNSTEGMDTMSDNMTAVDGSMNGGTMANDTMGNGGMMANDSMTTNSTSNTTM
ncbi:hypothetical protein [uncultured Sphingomonas sp.]|uniref:hypothetical protein n=1 Tax=uncultured Sphingomonas sp. TaxID=158754 RepID=UPI0035C976BF